VEFNNDATCLVTISFCMPLGDVLELNDVLYVPGLNKNLLSVSCMTNLQGVVEFVDQHVIIGKCGSDTDRVLTTRVHGGGLYMLLFDLGMHGNDNMCEL
jgi:hypothetical protein